MSKPPLLFTLFCSGDDIQGFSASGDRLPALLKELTAYLHSAVGRFCRMDKPILTAINGPAASAGLSLAMLGNIAIAAPSAHFAVAYTALRMSPDGDTSWLLPRLIGLRQAQEVALLNTRVSAAEAAAIGLITRVAAEMEAHSISASGGGTEGKEGAAAFITKRKPDFRGVG